MENKNLENKENVTILKGFAALMIILSHTINNNYPDFLQFLRYGSIWVGLFFFFSGYGLLYNYKKNENYLKHFWKKRFLKLYLPVIICEIIYFIIYKFVFGDNFTILESILGIFGIKLFNTALWFIQCLFIWYLIFYIIFKNKKICQKSKIILIVLCYILYMIVMIILDFLKIADTWWYLSTLCFILGILICENKDWCISFLNTKKGKIINYIFIVLEIILLILLTIIDTNKSFTTKINSNYILIFLQLVLNPVNTFNIINNFKINNRLRKIGIYIGNISMYIFFYHRLFIRTFDTYIKGNKIIRIVFVIFCTILLSSIFYEIKKVITKKNKILKN